MKKVAILQSNYIPWKGYFDMINIVDEFVFYDDVQYTKNDWRNRNKIKTPMGIKWITIPVKKQSLSQKINETKVVDQRWRKQHWGILYQNYKDTDYFCKYSSVFENLYLGSDEVFLSKINYSFIKIINDILGINTKIKYSNEFNLSDDRNLRLVEICENLNTDIYVSGPAAKNYLDKSIFKKNKIKVEWMDYEDYPEYKQLHPPFDHGVAILDLIFNEGPNAYKFMKSFK